MVIQEKAIQYQLNDHITGHKILQYKRRGLGFSTQEIESPIKIVMCSSS